jgi:heat shock protein HslJ
MTGRSVRALVLVAGLAGCHAGAPGNAAPAPSPVGVEWKLAALGGAPVGATATGQPATLVLTELSGQASGYAGCNRFSGTFTLTGSSLAFGPLAMTSMACAKGGDLERRYTSALAETTSYTVTGSGLELRKGSLVLARFTR